MLKVINGCFRDLSNSFFFKIKVIVYLNLTDCNLIVDQSNRNIFKSLHYMRLIQLKHKNGTFCQFYEQNLQNVEKLSALTFALYTKKTITLEHSQISPKT